MVVQPLVKSQKDYVLSEDKLKRKEIIHSSYDFLQTLSRINQVNLKLLDNPTYKNVVASYIYLLNSTSVIRQEDKSLTEHYKNYQLLLNSEYPQYPAELIQDYIYTLRSSWASDSGTLGFYLNLFYEDFQYHYLSPSELGFYSSLSLLKFIQAKNYSPALNRYIGKYLNIAQAETEVNAAEFYNLTTELWAGLGLTETFKILDFLPQFLQQVQLWYLNLNPNQTLNAIELELKEIALICFKFNLHFEVSQEYDFKRDFVFSQLSPIYFTVFKSILERRRLMIDTLNIDNLNDSLIEEKLIKDYLVNVPIYLEPNLIKENYLNLLEQLAPPGGFNLILVATANFLLANAYNLLVKEEAIAAANKLVYIAGYSLSKSNLKQLKLVGKNLIVLSELEVETDPKDFDNILI